MKRAVGLIVAVATVAIGLTPLATASGTANDAASSVYGIKLPAGYRDWRMISVAQVGPPFNDLRVKLGNNIAIKAYRDGTRPFPDGTIIVRLAYTQVMSEENNKAFRAGAEKRGLSQDQIEKLLAASSVGGAPTNVQFMVKDSAKYASTGGWGFAQFTNGKPDGEAVQNTCFSCHAPAKGRDFVFTDYAP
jgi:hypothetical protein